GVPEQLLHRLQQPAQLLEQLADPAVAAAVDRLRVELEVPALRLGAEVGHEVAVEVVRVEHGVQRVLGDLADLVVAVEALALLLDPFADRAHDLLDVDGVRLDLEAHALTSPPAS